MDDGDREEEILDDGQDLRDTLQSDLFSLENIVL